MSDGPAPQGEPSSRNGGQAGMVRAAAEALRRIAHDVPRGPWRWAHADLHLGEPPLTDVPGGARRGPGGNPLEEIEGSSVTPHPVPGRRAEPVHPEIADALAAVLDGLAGRIDDGDDTIDDGISRPAVALARLVLRMTATSTATRPPIA
jgi:hypothetical protein